MSRATDFNGGDPEAPTTRVRLLVRLHDLAAIVVVGGFAAFLWDRREHLGSVLDISPLQVASLCGVVVLTWLAVAGQNYLLYRASDIQVGFWECVVLTAGSGFGNYLPMRLGTLVRARYLKSVHGLGYARFGSVFGIRTILTLAATGVLGLAGTAVVGLEGGRWSVELLLAFAFLILVPAVAWVVPLPPGPPARDGRAASRATSGTGPGSSARSRE